MTATAEHAAAVHEMSLREISVAALGASCGYCERLPSEPCLTEHPGGTHVARMARARKYSLITTADFALALDAVAPFTEATVLYAAGIARAA